MDAPAELFDQIVGRLRNTCQAVLFTDEETSSVMQEKIHSLNAPVVNPSSLIYDCQDTIAVLSHVDAFVSVDAGIAHTAGAMGIPGVVLFGPFSSETHAADHKYVVPVSASLRETHRGCAEINYLRDVTSPCFEAIKVDHVIEAFDDAVDRKINATKIKRPHHEAQKQIETGDKFVKSSGLQSFPVTLAL